MTPNQLLAIIKTTVLASILTTGTILPGTAAPAPQPRGISVRTYDLSGFSGQVCFYEAHHQLGDANDPSSYNQVCLSIAPFGTTVTVYNYGTGREIACDTYDTPGELEVTYDGATPIQVLYKPPGGDVSGTNTLCFSDSSFTDGPGLCLLHLDQATTFNLLSEVTAPQP